MSRRTSTIQPDYFEDLYAKNPDPWRFRSSAYERDKYADTLALLTQVPYRTALEIGCSIGVFTRSLAPLCGHLIAMDPSAHALGAARETCAGVANVSFVQGMAPRAIPEGRFDLIVLSEVLYYLEGAEAEATAGVCCDRLAEGGQAVLCHWLGETDYPLTGEAAAEIFLAEARARNLPVETRRRAAYRLDTVGGPVR